MHIVDNCKFLMKKDLHVHDIQSYNFKFKVTQEPFYLIHKIPKKTVNKCYS